MKRRPKKSFAEIRQISQRKKKSRVRRSRVGRSVVQLGRGRIFLLLHPQRGHNGHKKPQIRRERQSRGKKSKQRRFFFFILSSGFFPPLLSRKCYRTKDVRDDLNGKKSLRCSQRTFAWYESKFNNLSVNVERAFCRPGFFHVNANNLWRLHFYAQVVFFHFESIERKGDVNTLKASYLVHISYLWWILSTYKCNCYIRVQQTQIFSTWFEF